MIVHFLLEHLSYEQQMRVYRDAKLKESDWAMTSDAPTDKTAWAAYRQALRDFPATWEPGAIADFPEPPAPDNGAQSSTDAG